jgi:uncharacterized membrane protein YsdA (DUF1294 family)
MPVLGSVMFQWIRANVLVVLALYAAMSLATFVAFAWDKSCARRGRRRVPENTLHLLELLCGWPGALAGQRWLRHKSAKLSYRIVLWAIVAVHVAGWSAFAYACASGARDLGR